MNFDDDDAGLREVFRGELSEVDLAAGVLEGAGIECQRRWEQAGGATFTIAETALVPGRSAILLVPSVAYAEQWSDLSSEVAETRSRRRAFGRVVAFLILGPVALWLIGAVIVAVRELLR